MKALVFKSILVSIFALVSFSASAQEITPEIAPEVVEGVSKKKECKKGKSCCSKKEAKKCDKAHKEACSKDKGKCDKKKACHAHKEEEK